MKKSSTSFRFSLLFIVSTIIFFIPLVIHGQKSSIPTQIVPATCTGPNGECQWQDLLKLVNNLITYLLYASVAVATYTFGFSGFEYYLSGGNPSKVEKAKKMFGRTFWGMFYVFLAWLIIQAVLTGLGLKNGYSILIK